MSQELNAYPIVIETLKNKV